MACEQAGTAIAALGDKSCGLPGGLLTARRATAFFDLGDLAHAVFSTRAQEIHCRCIVRANDRCCAAAVGEWLPVGG